MNVRVFFKDAAVEVVNQHSWLSPSFRTVLLASLATIARECSRKQDDCEPLGVYIGSIFWQKRCALASSLGPLACGEKTSEIRVPHKQIHGHIEL